MSLSRRRFIQSGLAGATGLLLAPAFSIFPSFALSNNSRVSTVSFSGTGCTRDEGEVSRPESNFWTGNILGSDKRIYLPETGYIPVRINQELSGGGGGSVSGMVQNSKHSVRGVGENDWAIPRDNSETLMIDGPLSAPHELLNYIKSGSFTMRIGSYAKGDQRSSPEQGAGWSMPALALHGANLSAASGAQMYNLIGHSRGAVECIMAAWFLYAYGDETVRNTPVNIIAIDPVPGPGEWYGILTQLPPNVVNYVGIYAWDHSLVSDHPFQAVVPRPNGRMRGENNNISLKNGSWKYLADNAQQRNPLAPGNYPQPQNYDLYACRGRHGTVAGNTTKDGEYDPNKLSDEVAPVPELIYKLTRGFLTSWGTTFSAPCAIDQNVQKLRQDIHTFHRDFDKMGGGATRDSTLPRRPYVRRISSTSGRNGNNTKYMDDVVGDPPYKLSYPVTKDRTNPGWVKWKFL